MRALRDEGLLEFRRGHGIRVSGTPQRSAVAARARDLVAFARQQGYQPDELITIIPGNPLNDDADAHTGAHAPARRPCQRDPTRA